MRNDRIAVDTSQAGILFAEDGLPRDKTKTEELAGLTGTVRESSRLRNKAAMSAKGKQEASKAQHESGRMLTRKLWQQFETLRGL